MPETSEPQPHDRLASWVGIAVQIIAAGAALAAWVAVVGGARVWAKLYSAGISPEWIAPAYSERALIGEGLRALLVPLLLGAIAAGVLLTRRTPAAVRALPTDADFEEWLTSRQAKSVLANRKAQRYEDEAFLREKFDEHWREKIKKIAQSKPSQGTPSRTPSKKEVLQDRATKTAAKTAEAYGSLALGVLSLVFTLAIAGAGLLLSQVHGLWILAMLLATALFALTLFVVARRQPSQRVFAAAVFGVVVLWAGVLSFFAIAGRKDPKLNLGLVVRKSSVSCVGGFFVLRSDGDVYIARRVSGGLQVVVTPKEHVVTVAVGPLKSTRKDWPVETAGLPLVKFFYDIGFLGIKNGAQTHFAQDDPGYADAPASLRDETRYMAHPAFQPTLGVRRRSSKR